MGLEAAQEGELMTTSKGAYLVRVVLLDWKLHDVSELRSAEQAVSGCEHRASNSKHHQQLLKHRFSGSK